MLKIAELRNTINKNASLIYPQGKGLLLITGPFYIEFKDVNKIPKKYKDLLDNIFPDLNNYYKRTNIKGEWIIEKKEEINNNEKRLFNLIDENNTKKILYVNTNNEYAVLKSQIKKITYQEELYDENKYNYGYQKVTYKFAKFENNKMNLYLFSFK